MTQVHEKRLVEIITSPVNIKFFLQFIKKVHKIDEFFHCCNEFPIIIGNKYHFIDIFGYNSNSFLFFEAKTNQIDLEKAQKQCNVNKSEYKKNDLFTKKEIGIYYKTLIKRFKLKDKPNKVFLPLILNKNLIENYTELSLQQLMENHSNFLLSNLIKKFPGLKQKYEQQWKPDLVPYLPLDVQDKNKKIIRFHKLEGKPIEISIQSELTNLPKRFVSSLRKENVFKLLKGGKYSIQFFLDGRNRPSYFFEIDKDQYLLLEHRSRQVMRVGPVFNEFVAIDCQNNGADPLLFSAICIDKGKYSVKKDVNKLKLFLNGLKYQINLTLKLGRNLMCFFKFDDRTKQKRMEDFK
ncbi:MAG: hypothetical protein ACTSRG_03400 [Candidatus Helarchaeota archaeon]